ncbi:hypothetical protein B0H17DRAFT_1140317 [Mycena rosella]|uniref:RRM domain-containing protein n=1 Tax=Mycena rosella TaxID=1033263 RepID=A0AAD7D659_MYCRO|nr:hypothetical protein B0H17DRAFT_1140317 [Mycena rosella]
MAFELDDRLYTAAEEDPFSIKPLLLQPRRRRSSMLNKWIQDQQQVPTNVVDVEHAPSHPASRTRSNPYLAYPELGSPTFNASAVSVNSYDLLEDDDIPPEDQMPATPITTPSRRGSKLLQTPSSFRGFHIPFRSSSPAGSVATSSGTTPRTPSRGLFFPRAPRSSTGSAHVQHTRSSSLSTLNILGENNSLPPPSTPKSRWRPSVLGHFGMSPSQASVVPADTLHTRSRPSISSNHTYTTTTLTTTDSDMPATPPQSSGAESSRARSRSYGSMLQSADNASSFSFWSGTSPSYLDILERSPLGSTRATSTMSCEGYIGMPPRVPFGPKPGSRLATSNKDPAPRPVKQGPEVAYSSETKSRTLPRVSFASLGTRAKRKKKLVISGIAAGDTRKFDAAKRWCESFGEVSQITRMPNDDLHVHFRNAEVADTVCRVRAKVYIRGVGSVQLSWYTGNRTENSR